VTLSAHTIAQQSYARCLRSEDFFERFYEILLESHPAIPPMFEETYFPRQRQLLKHGLGLLMSYGNKPDPALIERLAARHSRSALNVSPDLYPAWVDSLVQVVSERDPKFDEDIERAWRAVVEPGITFMQGHYES
jgi:hemoglobin-like flavoprotein